MMCYNFIVKAVRIKPLTINYLSQERSQALSKGVIMSYKWKPSKTQARAFAQQMQEIDKFCYENGISQSRSSDSYYFILNGKQYRVSNHSIEASNRRAFNCDGEQVRELYHENGRDSDTIYIQASKTRIIDIYNDLKAGYKLDGRGYRM